MNNWYHDDVSNYDNYLNHQNQIFTKRLIQVKIKYKADSKVFEIFHNQITIYLNHNRMISNIEKFFYFKF